MVSRYNTRTDKLNSIRKVENANNGFKTQIQVSEFKFDFNVITVLVQRPFLKIIPVNVNENSQPVNVVKIPIDSIEYYRVEGEKYREQVITGGGSGGVDVGGAIIGSMIAGDAGMIIGGTRKVKDIESKTIEHDTRHTSLSYFVDGNRKNIKFNLDLYQYLLDNIPEKEYEVVMINNKKKYINADSVGGKDKLKELKEMLDEHLITEEEYKAKKRDILNNI